MKQNKLFLIALTTSLVLSGILTSFAGIDGYDGDGMPFAKDGFGVRRNFYQSGRISAKVADIAGIFSLNYVGAQPFQKQEMYASNEQCTFGRCLRPMVKIDGVPYKLDFENTVHYPFGYVSECTLDGVRLRHSLVLDRNVLFRRLTVVSNPQGKEVKAGASTFVPFFRNGLRPRPNADGSALVATCAPDGVEVRMEIGSSQPVEFPLNTDAKLAIAKRPDLAFGAAGRMTGRYDVWTKGAVTDQVFWIAFDKADGEDLSLARVDRVFADFAAKRPNDVRFATGDAMVDGLLGFVPAMFAAHEVDGIGAFRASPTYWVWGWDAMVHASTLAACGRAAEVKRMLAFFRDVADPEHGIFHAYGTVFRKLQEGSDRPGNAMTLMPPVQLFWVILLDDYVNMTGDVAFRDECLPFARTLVERAKAFVPQGELLPRGISWYPDNPYSVGQDKDDVALINCSVYWQGLRAWTDLTGEGAADAEAVGREIVAKLWDAKANLWADSWDVAGKKTRPLYPLYSLYHVSSFARGLTPAEPGVFADAMTREFLMGNRLPMFGYRSLAYCADGNQMSSYYPVTGSTYWNAQNAAGRTEALARFRDILSRHSRVVTYPEGQTADVVNGDPSDYSDELGNKQFFAEKGWLADALNLWLGIGYSRDGLRIHPMNDGVPFAVRGLTLRGGTLDVEMTGAGSKAACTFNGAPLAGDVIPWTAFKPGRNVLKIQVR